MCKFIVALICSAHLCHARLVEWDENSAASDLDKALASFLLTANSPRSIAKSNRMAFHGRTRVHRMMAKSSDDKYAKENAPYADFRKIPKNPKTEYRLELYPELPKKGVDLPSFWEESGLVTLLAAPLYPLAFAAAIYSVFFKPPEVQAPAPSTAVQEKAAPAPDTKKADEKAAAAAASKKAAEEKAQKAAEEKAAAAKKVADEKAKAAEEKAAVAKKAAEDKAAASQKAADEKAKAAEDKAKKGADDQAAVAQKAVDEKAKAAEDKAAAAKKAAEEKAAAAQKVADEKAAAEKKAAEEKAAAAKKAADEKAAAAEEEAKKADAVGLSKDDAEALLSSFRTKKSR